MGKLRDLRARYVDRHIARIRKLLQGRPWLELAAVLLGCLVCSGLAPGAILWIQILGLDAKLLIGECESGAADGDAAKLLPGDYCDRQNIALIRAFIVSTSVSCFILLPVLVLAGDFGTHLISVVGGVMVSVGHLLFFSLVIFGHAFGDIAQLILLYMAVVVADTGAQLVNTVVQGFVWHFDGSRSVVFVLFTAICNLSGLLPLLIRFVVMILARIQGFNMVNASFFGMLFYFCLPIIGTVLIFFSAITQDEYDRTAEDVLLMAMPERRQFSVTGVFRDIGRALSSAQQVMQFTNVNTFSHMIFALTLAFSTTWATMYTYFAADYGMDLFSELDSDTGQVGNASAGYQMARLVLILVCVVGTIMSIGGSALASHYGMVPVVCSVLAAEVIATFTITGKHWLEQVVTALAASVVLALNQVMVSRHMHHYAPPKVLASVLCLFNCYRAGAQLLLGFTSLWLVRILGKEATFVLLLSLSMASMVFYLIYMTIVGFPDTSPILFDEVEQLCQGYGCKTLGEVLHIMGLVETPAAIKVLTESGREVQGEFVMRVKPERFEQMTDRLSIEELAQLLETGPAWCPVEERNVVQDSADLHTFAITPQLWSQFMHTRFDISLLERRSSVLQDGDTPGLDGTILMPGLEVERHSSTLSLADPESAPDSNPGFVATHAVAQSIVRAMNARVHTKELVRLVRRGDKRMLEYWMMVKEVKLMQEALWDMVDWDDGLEKTYSEEGDRKSVV